MHILLSLLAANTLFAASPDLRFWYVTSKTCAGKAAPVMGKEIVHFTTGKLGHQYLYSQDKTQVCYRSHVFSRENPFVKDDGVTYRETAPLTATAVIEKCKSKKNKSILREEQAPLVVPAQVMTVLVKGNSGTIDMSGSEFCPQGQLHLEVESR